MKFVNRRTGCILEPASTQVEDQLRANPEYAPWICEALTREEDGPEGAGREEGGGPEGAEGANGPKGEDERAPLGRMSKAALLDAARAAGIAVKTGATRSEILALLQQEG